MTERVESARAIKCDDADHLLLGCEDVLIGQGHHVLLLHFLLKLLSAISAECEMNRHCFMAIRALFHIDMSVEHRCRLRFPFVNRLVRHLLLTTEGAQSFCYFH